MLMTGQAVEINEADDDEQHIQEMMPVLEELSKDPKTPQFILEMFRRHLEGHMEQLTRKEEEAKAMQKQAQANANLMAPQGGQPGVDRPPVAGGMEAGQKDVTPGSPQARTQPRTGRGGSGLSQTQAMTG